MGCCVVAGALLAPAARANVDPMLGLDQFNTLWTGTIHHVRTDDLSGMGAPGDFQRWDTTITTTAAKTVVETTYTSHLTIKQTCQGALNTYTETGTGHYKGPYRATHARISVVDSDGETRVFFMVPNVLVTETSTSPCTPGPFTHLSSSASDHEGGDGFDDEDFGGIGGAPGKTSLSVSHSVTINGTRFDDQANLRMCGEPSGYRWAYHGPPDVPGARFPDSKSLEDLSEPFRADVKAFFHTLAHARRVKANGQLGAASPIEPFVETTLRPDERAWLMNNAYRVAGGWQKFRPDNPPVTPKAKANLAAEEPGDVGTYPHGGVDRVPICWLHQDANGNPDLKASKKAANQMRMAFPIANFGAAYPSNHTKGKAIDMLFAWAKRIAVRDDNGHWQKLDPGSSFSSHRMWAVGRTFDVIKQPTGDPPHWSLTGN